MKKNILIVGASGSIGHEFTKHYDLERNVEKILHYREETKILIARKYIRLFLIIIKTRLLKI